MPTYYCTWADVEDRLSADGAQLRADDDIPRAKAYALRRATQYVAGYAGLHYSAAALAASAWVNEVCADCAWFYLSTRRNNPPSKAAADAFELATKQLEEVRDLKLRIPDAAMNKGFAPVLSNQRVRQWPVSEVKTVKPTSTGQAADYTRFTDPTNDSLDYSI